ncbi:unnamed protein product, partial [marine sediment metagenome]
MPTLTVYSSSSDGHLIAYSNIDYVTAQTAAIANQISTGLDYISTGQWYTSIGGWWYVERGGLFFDTSVLPDGCTIISATLTIVPYGTPLDNDFNLTVVSGADLADPLVAANFGDLLDDVISFGTSDTSDWVIDTATDITLNIA